MTIYKTKNIVYNGLVPQNKTPQEKEILKMKKQININGEIFTVMKPSTLTEKEWLLGNYYLGRTLLQAYGKVSQAKQQIYAYWARWALESYVRHLTVASKNTNMFTLNGLLNLDGETYAFIITKTRQELYKLESEV